MIGNFTENMGSADVSTVETQSLNHVEGMSQAPTLEELKEKLQEFFPSGGFDTEKYETESLVQGNDISNCDSTIELDDGTVVELPDQTTETNDIRGCKLDDQGNAYMQDGKLEPNSEYTLNGNVYTTDGLGRIVTCEGKPQLSPENPRDNQAQREAGGDDRKENDQGGHIIGRDMNGDGGGGNLVAMDGRINQSDYKRMENDIKSALQDGKDVTTKTEITYQGDSERPDKIKVTVTVDGKDTVYTFDNNMDNALVDEVPQQGKDTVTSVLEETGGTVSSIKQECDEDGNVVKTTVNITYTGDDSATHRTKVVIENAKGE